MNKQEACERVKNVLDGSTVYRHLWYPQVKAMILQFTDIIMEAYEKGKKDAIETKTKIVNINIKGNCMADETFIDALVKRLDEEMKK